MVEDVAAGAGRVDRHAEIVLHDRLSDVLRRVAGRSETSKETSSSTVPASIERARRRLHEASLRNASRMSSGSGVEPAAAACCTARSASAGL